MTDRQLEARLRAWYRTELDAIEQAPITLRVAVIGIPDVAPAGGPFGRFFPTRRAWALATVALLLLALMVGFTAAIGSGLVRLPWTSDRSVVPAGEIDACDLLGRGLGRAGIGDVIGGSVGFTAGHEREASPWDATSCVFGWDDRYARPHLFIRTLPTSADEVEALLAIVDGTNLGEDGSLAWAPRGQRVWVRSVRAGSVDPWTGVAVSVEPYFFLVTERDDANALALASAVAAELGFPEFDPEAP